jgi:hypothetical protein
MNVFVNRRYERESDRHVWHDDHIEWSVIAAAPGELGQVSASPTIFCRIGLAEDRRFTSVSVKFART